MHLSHFILMTLAAVSTVLAQYSSGPLELSNGELSIPESSIQSLASQVNLPPSVCGNVLWSIGNINSGNIGGINWLQHAQQIAVVQRITVVQVITIATQVVRVIPTTTRLHPVLLGIANCQGGQIIAGGSIGGGQIRVAAGHEISGGISGGILGGHEVSGQVISGGISGSISGGISGGEISGGLGGEIGGQVVSSGISGGEGGLIFQNGGIWMGNQQVVNAGQLGSIADGLGLSTSTCGSILGSIGQIPLGADIRSRCGVISKANNVPMIKIVQAARQCHQIMRTIPHINAQHVTVLKTVAKVFVVRAPPPKVITVVKHVTVRVQAWTTLTKIPSHVWNSCLQGIWWNWGNNQWGLKVPSGHGLMLGSAWSRRDHGTSNDEPTATESTVEDLETKTASVVDAVAENAETLGTGSEEAVMSWVSEYATKNKIDPQVVSNIASHVSDMLLSQNQTAGKIFQAFGNVAMAKSEPVIALAATNESSSTVVPPAVETVAAPAPAPASEASAAISETNTAIAQKENAAPSLTIAAAVVAVTASQSSSNASVSPGNLAVKSNSNILSISTLALLVPLFMF
ncbi:UNVERIFIED_CONTAM: hypothetical protein HDU68_007931 [Siphonaria sp. JEL0065]|nr:hypothetical protein HDU68_007931 [Siphonaria sp. JEL0065]